MLVVTVKATDAGRLFNLGIQGFGKEIISLNAVKSGTPQKDPPLTVSVATTLNTTQAVFVLEFFIRIYLQCQHLHHNSQSPLCGVDIRHSI